jgi:uncharacterized protein
MSEIPARRQTWTTAGPVEHSVPATDIAAYEERAVATMADPAPFSLYGFATGTWIAGAIAAGWLAPTAFALTAPVLIVFAGLAQFIGGLFALRRTSTFGATAFCSYGANNVIVGTIFALQGSGHFPMHGAGATILAFEFFSFTFISLALALGSLRLNPFFFLTLLALVPGFGLVGVHLVTGGLDVIGYIGGWFLMASAALAYITGTVLMVNSAWKRTVVPLFGSA